MLSIGISCILLLIYIISTVRGVETVCKGRCTKLSCPGTYSEDKANINLLWKKQTGERVIWRDSGVDTIGQTYSNGRVNISEDLSLVIGECEQADQGIYILLINGQLLCKVKLLVNDKCKRSSENLCGIPKLSTDVTQEHEDLENVTSLNRYHVTLIIPFICFAAIIGMVIKRNNTSKNNNASEIKEISLDGTVVQWNTASEHFI